MCPIIRQTKETVTFQVWALEAFGGRIRESENQRIGESAWGRKAGKPSGYPLSGR